MAGTPGTPTCSGERGADEPGKIGRAAGRGRGENSGGAVSFKKKKEETFKCSRIVLRYVAHESFKSGASSPCEFVLTPCLAGSVLMKTLSIHTQCSPTLHCITWL